MERKWICCLKVTGSFDVIGAIKGGLPHETSLERGLARAEHIPRGGVVQAEGWQVHRPWGRSCCEMSREQQERPVWLEQREARHG